MKQAARLVCALVVGALASVAAGAEEIAGVPGQTLPFERARMLPVSSAAAVEGLRDVLEDLGFRLQVRQGADGLLVTHGTGVKRLRKHGLRVSPVLDTPPSQVQVHAFVSRAVEPAHVHVDAIVTTTMRADGTASHGCSLGEVEKQVLDALEKKLGAAGHAIPDSTEERKALAASLLPADGSPPCASGALQIPTPIPGSKVPPMFPAEAVLSGEEGRVHVLARVLEDGSTVPVRVLRGSGTAHSSELEQACMAAVALWRYRPARNGTCPVDFTMTVAVEFLRSQGARPPG